MYELDCKGAARLGHDGDEQVFLLPGQWYFGANRATVKTLLGSCIAFTLWHPRRLIGGMCHFLLPTRARYTDAPLDGRFGDEAMALLAREIHKAGTHVNEYEVHLYGGADTMPEVCSLKFHIGQRNVEKSWEIVEEYGFQLHSFDVGGCEPRNVTINLANGQVMLKRGETLFGKTM